MKRLAKKLADKWNRPCSSTIGLLRTRFAINLVRSKNRCIRGARTPCDLMSHKLDREDGAGFRLFTSLESQQIHVLLSYSDYLSRCLFQEFSNPTFLHNVFRFLHIQFVCSYTPRVSFSICLVTHLIPQQYIFYYKKN